MNASPVWANKILILIKVSLFTYSTFTHKRLRDIQNHTHIIFTSTSLEWVRNKTSRRGLWMKRKKREHRYERQITNSACTRRRAIKKTNRRRVAWWHNTLSAEFPAPNYIYSWHLYIFQLLYNKIKQSNTAFFSRAFFGTLSGKLTKSAFPFSLPPPPCPSLSLSLPLLSSFHFSLSSTILFSKNGLSGSVFFYRSFLMLSHQTPSTPFSGWHAPQPKSKIEIVF